MHASIESAVCIGEIEMTIDIGFITLQSLPQNMGNPIAVLKTVHCTPHSFYEFNPIFGMLASYG